MIVFKVFETVSRAINLLLYGRFSGITLLKNIHTLNINLPVFFLFLAIGQKRQYSLNYSTDILVCLLILHRLTD